MPKNRTKYTHLEDRLIDFAVEICRIAEDLPTTRTGNHVAGQMIRCGTSPPPNYGEAQGAESRRDFIHKLKVCLKELRETSVWLRILDRARLYEQAALSRNLDECNELVSIFAASILTAKRNSQSKRTD